ncbi:monocarboxylate transporter 9 isoform X4 [Drosophila mauritiana]|nr:monocarboxylate transporter 9 isoform X4 [Drosophila mauritiana]
MVIPPDGGFGWVIMVLSFLAQLIIDGIIFTIGVLLPSIAQDLDVSISSVSFVASVQIGCYFTSGAFSAVLINRFGFRKVAIAGVLCSTTTILASSWSVSLTMLIFFYSVLVPACAGGITLSMIWASSQLIVGYYFERYRPMANGFSCSGGGAGIVLFTFLNSWLVPIIGWRNMLRTQAGLIMLILLMVVAYVEVAPTQVGLYHLPGSSETSSDEYYGNFYVHDYLRQSALTAGSKSILSTYEPPPKKKGCAKFCPSSNCCWRRRKKSENDEEQNLLIRPAPLEREDLFYTGPAEYEKPRSTENLDGKEFHLMGSDKNTQQVNYGIKNIHLDDESDRVSRVHKERRWSNENTKKQNSCRNSRFMLTLLKLFDYRLLKQFEFKILVASAFLFPMGFNIPFVYSSARTTIPIEYARMIGPIIGISNLVMRNILGILAYKRRTWTLGLCGCGLVFGGFSVLISAFYGENLIWFQFLYGFSYAVAPAVYSTLRGLIYVKYLGLSKLTNAFGITSLAMGMGAFIGTTIAGKLIGITGNYSAAFCFAGLCLVMSGCLKLLLPALIKCRNRMAK